MIKKEDEYDEATDDETKDPAFSTTTSLSDSRVYLTVDQYLDRFNIRASTNVVLLGEILISILVLWITDTLNFYGNILDYSAWSCGEDPSKTCLSRTEMGTVYNRSTLCNLIEETGLTDLLHGYAFIWENGPGQSFSTEYGMICFREDESETILDIYGIGAGVGALVGGILSDLFGRDLCFKISVPVIMVSLLTTVLCGTVQILTLGLFALGFSVFMALTSLIIWSVELLPLTLRQVTLTTIIFLSYVGTIVGYGIRVMCYSSWRLLDLCLMVINLILISIIVHTPVSPRYYINKDITLTRVTLARLGVVLKAEEEISAPQTTDTTEDWRSFNSGRHKHLFFHILKLLYLIAVIGFTSNASAGKVWELTTNPTLSYPIQAALYMISIPALFAIFLYQCNIKFTLQVIGWVIVGCYFIGEIPLGRGIFLLSNVVNVAILLLIRVIYVLVTYLILENMPTCYRGTIFGLSIFIEKCFVKLGKYVLAVDHSPYDHGNSFLVFGVVYLSFVYTAGLLPPHTPKQVPNNIWDYNWTFCSSVNERCHLLTDMHAEPSTSSKLMS